MNILFIVLRSIEINSSTSIWNNAVINGLIENGHLVDVLTLPADKNHSNYDQSLTNKNCNIIEIRTSSVQRIANIARKNKVTNMLRGVAYHLRKKFQVYDIGSSYINTINNIELEDQKYDLIITSSDPKSSHLFGLEYKSKRNEKIPWIQLWSDPFLGDITSNSSWNKRKIEKEEAKLLKRATKIVYISRLLRNDRACLYPECAKKMFFYPIPFLESRVGKSKKSEVLTFVYCGDYFSKVRDIRPLYNAIKETKHRLIICGDSDVKLKETPNIKIFPRVSYQKVMQIENKADVLVHLSNLSGIQIPGKIYQYSGTEKNILFILDGNVNKIKEEFGQYNRYVFSLNKESNLLDTLNNPNVWQNCNTEIINEFSPSYVAKEIIDLTETVEEH